MRTYLVLFLSCKRFSFHSGAAPSPGNATNHNHATATTGGTVTGSSGSNFKRQNTVDAATIKENTARVSASRPSAPKNSPGQLDTSEFFFRYPVTFTTVIQPVLFVQLYFFFCGAILV